MIIHTESAGKMLTLSKSMYKLKNSNLLNSLRRFKYVPCPDVYMVLKFGLNTVSTKNRFVKASTEISPKNGLAVFVLKITHFRKWA